MARIRFTSPVLQHFTGPMGLVVFEDGVSVGDVASVEIDRLAISTGIEVEQEDGSWAPGGPFYRMAVNRVTAVAPIIAVTPREAAEPDQRDEIIPAPQNIKLEPEVVPDPVEAELAALDAQVEAAVEEVATPEKVIEAPAESVAETPAEPAPATKHTREQLEAIADEKGIKGLREIANPIGVKDSSIDGLIREILARQG